MKKTILIVVILAIVIAIAYYLYPRPQSEPTLPTQTNQTSTVSMATSSVVTTVTSTSTPTSSTPQIFTSSSSAQVGDFTVVTNCKAVSIDGLASVGEINILKGSSTVQTILTMGIAPGGSVCPKPESKDINSDGYPDFMIPYNYGNAATDFEYWLYNSSTNQFSCPNVQPSGKPWTACSLDESN